MSERFVPKTRCSFTRSTQQKISGRNSSGRSTSRRCFALSRPWIGIPCGVPANGSARAAWFISVWCWQRVFLTRSYQAKSTRVSKPTHALQHLRCRSRAAFLAGIQPRNREPRASAFSIVAKQSLVLPPAGATPFASLSPPPKRIGRRRNHQPRVRLYTEQSAHSAFSASTAASWL